MSDFSGYGFAAGSLRGQRSFRVDSLGRLTGVSFQRVWRPGTNEAACGRGDETGAIAVVRRMQQQQRQQMVMHTAALWATTTQPMVTAPNALPTQIAQPAAETPEQADEVEPEHDPAGCTCGFYAYYDGEDNPYHQQGGTIRGVIEGFGKTTLGDKGFRAQQARIVALCADTPAEPESMAPPNSKPERHRLTRFFSRHYDAVPFACVGAVLTAISAAVCVASSITVGPHWLIGVFVPLILLAAYVCVCASRAPYLPALHSRWIAHQPATGWTPDATVPDLIAKVRRNYPDVAWFDNEAAMLAAFPVDPSPVPEITPHTVEDFWTRSAS